MRRPITLLVLLLSLAASISRESRPPALQNEIPRAGSEQRKWSYLDVIRLSNELKSYEKTHWNVSAGEFATKVPEGRGHINHMLIIQSKLRLAADHHDADVISFDALPIPPERLKRLRRKKDVYFIEIYLASTKSVPQSLINKSLAGQVSYVLHEDFHGFRLLHPFAAIEESFADAFSYAAGLEIAANSGDKTLLENIRKLNSEDAAPKKTVNRCYAELDALYGKNLTVAQKLASRAPILSRCSKELGEDVDNAALSFKSAYSRYCYYATEKIEKYGLAKFVKALHADT